MTEQGEENPLTPADLTVGEPVFWETPWSKRIAALVVEIGADRVRVALKKKRQVADYWTSAERLQRSDFTEEHRRLEEDARGFFQRDLF